MFSLEQCRDTKRQPNKIHQAINEPPSPQARDISREILLQQQSEGKMEKTYSHNLMNRTKI